MDKYGVGQDKYCYPDSDVLKNKLNIREAHVLHEAERDFTLYSVSLIEFSEPPYDLSYMQLLHKQVFGLLYDWAGDIREVDISKADTRFCTVRRILPEANKIFATLNKKKYFKGLSKKDFVAEISELYADLNLVHPFREGNGRIQRIFFEHLALHNDYVIDWDVVSKEDWIEANIQGVYCNFSPMKNIFTLGLHRITSDYGTESI